MPLNRHLVATTLSAIAFAHAADAKAIELSWLAPPECPNRETVLHDVTRLAGNNEGLALIANLVVARTTDSRWRVTIDLAGSATGHRELTADNCAQLARAAALIIALAANPEAALDLPTEPPASGASSNPEDTATSISRNGRTTGEPPLSKPAAGQKGTPTEAEEDSPGSDVGAASQQAHPHTYTTLGTFAGIGYDHGSLPTGTGFVRLGGTLSHAPLELVLAVDLTAPSRSEFVGGYGARLRSTGAELLGCLAPTRGTLRTLACLGPRGEILFVKGYGTVADQFRYAARYSAVAAAEFAVPISESMQAGLLGELLLYLGRPNYVIENIDTVLYRQKWFGLRAVVSLSYRF